MIVGISGKMGAGKNFVADLLAEKWKQKYPLVPIVQMSFAEPLKHVVSFLFDCGEAPWTQKGKRSTLLIDEEKGLAVTCRDALQDLGTWVREQYGNDFWVNRLFSNWESGNQKGEVWIITDVRYMNEASKIQSLGGVLLRIESIQNEGTTRVDLSANQHESECSITNQHESEYSIDTNCFPFDEVIFNDSGVESLREKLEPVFLVLEKKMEK